MPQNKRESLIYTMMMCFTMVFIMSVYNVAMHHQSFDLSTIVDAWVGFPIAYVFAMCLDMFIVSKIAKGFAFRFLVKPDSAPIKKILSISISMVVCMVFFMSFYGAMEACVSTGDFSLLPIIWLTNIPKNFIMALPLQLIVAGPLVRYLFRRIFPVGTIL